MSLVLCRRTRSAGAFWALLAILGLAFPAADIRAEDRHPPSAHSMTPRIADIRPHLDRNDEAAALEAVQVALTEVGDGSSYVWYRHGGRLSGVVQPTQSFKDTLGRVCRHIVVTLSDVNRQKRTEGIACRLADGAWELDG